LRGTDQKTYALVGDGELNEGPIWEGALFAAHHKLNNFMAIVDENGFQAMGLTKDILGLTSIEGKFESFGFDVVSVDGHDEKEIDEAIRDLWGAGSSSPKAVIAKTIKGKGVSFMENDNVWHYTRLSEASYRQALKEIGGELK
jgi:transketolase